MDDMNVVFQQMLIPSVADGTTLTYSIPCDLSFERHTDIYNFYMDELSIPPVARFVQVVFRGIPKDTQMTLGNIAIFGYPLQNLHYFKGLFLLYFNVTIFRIGSWTVSSGIRQLPSFYSKQAC